MLALVLQLLRNSASMDVEKEEKLFSPSTKKVIEEISVTIAMDKGTMLLCPSTKRGIVFPDNSGEKQDVLITETVTSPGKEAVASTVGSESPVKKLKNKQTKKKSDH